MTAYFETTSFKNTGIGLHNFSAYFSELGGRDLLGILPLQKASNDLKIPQEVLATVGIRPLVVLTVVLDKIMVGANIGVYIKNFPTELDSLNLRMGKTGWRHSGLPYRHRAGKLRLFVLARTGKVV